MATPSQQIRFCTSADGVRIAYATSGKGPPLAMTANWLTHLEYQWRNLAWQPWLESLSRRHTLLRYDSRGCGLSDRNVADISFDSWVGDFEGIADTAGLDRFPLLGTCQGGPIAIEYAARHPERVSHLVLYGTYARGRLKRNAPREREIAEVSLGMASLGWAQETHTFMQSFASQWQPGGTLEHLRSWCELQRVTTSVENALRLMRTTFNVDVSESASRVKCPTLVIHPDRDRVVPLEEGRRLAGLIPGARFVQLETENHMPLPEEPAWRRFLDELHAFVPAAASGRDGTAFAGLSGREADVLEHIAQGLDNAQIAARLGLSEKTVRNHITRVFDKIEVENRSQAIVRAREAGLGTNTSKASS